MTTYPLPTPITDAAMIETERDAWTTIADTLEGYGGMPPWDRHTHCGGLCAVLRMMINDRVIQPAVSGSMQQRLREFMDRTPNTGWLFPRGEHIPRIKLVRRFARESS